jgi:hypothetical protein
MTGSQGASDMPDFARTHAQSRREQSAIGETTFFVLMLFFGMHTAVSVVFDGKLIVPYVVSFAAALGIISINIRQIEHGVVNWLMLLACVLLALALYTSNSGGDYFGHFRSSAQFVYSVVIGYAAFLGLTVLRRERLEGIFFWVSVFLIIGAALEIYGPIKPISDWFRETFNSWYGLYDSDDRDILSYGGYRPKFFSSEPSLLGLTTGIALFIWLSAKKSFTPPDLILAILLSGVAFFFIRSPNVLFGLVAFLLLLLLSNRNTGIWRLVSRLLVATYMAVTAFFPAICIYVTLTMPNAPAYMKGFSFFARIEAPFLIAADTLRSYPLFGIGLGNEDRMNQLAVKTFNDMGLLSNFATLAVALGAGQEVGNIFWQYWIVFGLVGVLIICVLLSRFLKIIRVPHHGIVILGIAATTFWQGFGGVSAPLAAYVLFMVAAVSKIRE